MALDRNSSSFLYPQFFDKPGRRNRLRGFNGVPVRGNEKIILWFSAKGLTNIVGLVFYNYWQSNTNGSVARGRSSHARRAFSENRTKKLIGPVAFLRVGVGPTTLLCKTQIVSKPQRKRGGRDPDRGRSAIGQTDIKTECDNTSFWIFLKQVTAKYRC